jgi:hypothetical protein
MRKEIMKKNSVLIIAFLIVSAFGLQTVSAQFPIRLPKIPKVKKPKIEQSTTTNQTEQNEDSSETTPSSVEEEPLDGTMSFLLDELIKTKVSVDRYNSKDYMYLVSRGGESEWLLRAVSMNERQKWAQEWLKTPVAKRKFNEAFDALAASAKVKLPVYIPNNNNFAFHNVTEEKMMKSVLENAPTLQIHKIGFYHSSWQIDKNSLGIPNARYKQGYAWVRDTSDDHQYCHLYQVNIIQNYAGGGTYAASYARFLGDTLFGCPAK